VFTLAVLVGKDGDGLGAQLGGSAERADGDLTTIGDEYFVEHGCLRSGWKSDESHIQRKEVTSK
jgi:hypothetical protein